MSDKSLLQFQLGYLKEIKNSEGKPFFPDLGNYTSREIGELYAKQQLITALKLKGFSQAELSKWPIDKLRQEHKNYLLDKGTVKDISDSLLFDILTMSATS